MMVAAAKTMHSTAWQENQQEYAKAREGGGEGGDYVIFYTYIALVSE